MARKRIPIPIVYKLKANYLSPHLYKEINVLYLDAQDGYITFRIPGNKDVKKMSMEKYKLLYEPCK